MHFTISNYPTKILEISHSTMGMFHSCPRKLEFSKFYNHNMRGDNLAGSGGNAIHIGVGAYLITRDKQAAIFAFMLAYPIHLCNNPTWNWSLEAAYGALLSVIAFLESRPDLELATIAGKPAVEVPFLINIHHHIANFLDVVYRGYIDLVFFDKINGNYFVIDLKNTARKINDFSSVFHYDTQCVPYALVLARALGKEIKSLQTNYLVQPVELMPKQPQFLEFEKTEQDIQEWAQDLLMDLNTMSVYYQSQWFPRRSNSCYAFNRRCKFFELCGTKRMETLKTMLAGMEKPEVREFTPWITLDLELAA